MKTTSYLKLENAIALDERGGVLHRYRYGQLLQEAKKKNGGKQLPHGLIAARLKEAEQHKLALSEREIRYRVQCADAYKTEAEVGSIAADLGSWRAICDAGFPPVTDAPLDPDELAASGLATAADEWVNQELDIPGLKPVISVRGRKVALVKGDEGATIADVAAYLDMCVQMHENFGKTVDQIRASLKTMREHSDGDDTNALEAWEAAIDDDNAAPADEEPTT